MTKCPALSCFESLDCPSCLLFWPLASTCRFIHQPCQVGRRLSGGIRYTSNLIGPVCAVSQFKKSAQSSPSSMQVSGSKKSRFKTAKKRQDSDDLWLLLDACRPLLWPCSALHAPARLCSLGWSDRCFPSHALRLPQVALFYKVL
jgi:hypothetical protein